jgi:uncharacterized protein YbaA (DUF1428 family)
VNPIQGGSVLEGNGMSYFAAILAAVPRTSRDAFAAHAQAMWEDFFAPAGAISQVETWGDQTPGGAGASFASVVGLAEDEAVVLTMIEWPDRATHDAAAARMVSPEGSEMMARMPLDFTRVVHGTFVPLVRNHAARQPAGRI